MSGKHKPAQNQPGTKTTVEETAGKPPQDPPPPQKLKCFQDILDIVHSLSDEEWRALTNDAPQTRSKVEFASLCTNIVISVGKSAVKSFLPTLIHTLGMEAVLTAEEQLKKRVQSESRSPSDQWTTPTKPAASSQNSDERSTVEPPEFICTMTEDFISEVKAAMQEAICKLASCKAFSTSWEPKHSPMAEEMTNVLSELFKKCEREDAPSTGQKMHKRKQKTESDITDITGKIVVIVLDLMDGGSVDRADLKTSDLLNAAAEKIKQIISNSEDSINKKTLLEQHKRRNAEELRAKATRAVSQVLLSTGVRKVTGGSPEMPSSLASEADLDSVLDAMAQSGFPTEMIRGHLESTSREIVDTIVGNIDMLSCHHKERSKSGLPSVVENIFRTINEKVRKFFHLSKQAVKESSTELDDLCLTEQTDVDSCTDKVIQSIVDSGFQKEVPLDKSGSSENREASPSSDNDSIIDIQNQHEVSSSHSAPGLKEPEVNILTDKSERFLTKATQVVSDLLVRSDRCSTSASTVSSKVVHDAAISIAETVVEALDNLVESSVIDSQSDSDTIIRSLEASTHTLNRSDISEGRVPSTPFNLFRRVRGYLQARFTTLKRGDETADSIQEAPVSDLQRSRDHSVSQLDDLTITCTNSIIGEIVQLYHSAESESESHVPAGDDESEAIHGIIQGLEELVKANSSSSENASSGRDLGGHMDRSFSDLDSALKVDSEPNVASSILSAESLFSDQFRGKAEQTVEDILLKTGGDFSTSVSTQSSEAVSTTDFQTCITERPSAAASSLSIKADCTASDITEMFLNHLRRYCSSTPLQKSFLSASRSIYKGVQKKVFGFFLGLRESFSAQVDPTKGADLEPVTSPRFKVDLDSCTDEVIVKIVELYKSELLLPKPSSSTLPQISHSMSLLSTFPCDHGIHEEDKVNKICSPVSSQTSIRIITVKPKGVVNEAVQEVSHISLKRAALKTAWDELSQCSVASTRGTSATPVLSESSTDSDNAPPPTADTVVDAIVKIVDQRSLDSSRGPSTTPVLSSTDSESAAVTVVETVVDVLNSVSQIESDPLSSDMSDLKSSKSEITASGIRQKPPQDDAQLYEALYVWNEDKVCLDSCTDEIISKVVDLYCSEFSDILSKESIQRLTSDSFHVLSKHLVHDALWKFVVPLPAEEPKKIPSATGVLFRRSLSTLMKRLNSSASEIARYVCTAFQGFLGSLHKSEEITSDSVRFFALFHLFRDVRRKPTEVFSLLKISDKSDISSTTNKMWTKSTRSTTPESKRATICSSAVSERSTNQKNGVIFKKPSSAAEEMTQRQFQRPSATNQLPPLITDEPIRFHEVGLRKLLGSMTGPSQACKSTSDSVMETSWVRNLLRDPVQVPLALVYPFVEESVKSLLLHFLSNNPALPNLISPDQDMQGTNVGFESQSRNSDKSAGFQCVSTNAVSHFTKALADLVVKSLRSTGTVSGNKDDPQTLLVTPEQMDLEKINDISGMDFASPSYLRWIASDVVRETLENFIISSQEGSSSCSSSSPLNDNSVLNPDPVVLKKRRCGFCFNICKKAPVFSLGFRKLKKVCPADLLSADHPPNSSSRNLQESLQGEPKDLLTPFKKARKRVSRIFSAISKALPNPLSCMTRPC